MDNPARLYINGNLGSGKNSLIMALCGTYVGTKTSRLFLSRGPQVRMMSVDGSEFNHYNQDRPGLALEVWSSGGRIDFLGGTTFFGDINGTFVVVLNGSSECFSKYVDYWTQFSISWGANPDKIFYVVTHADEERFDYNRWQSLVPNRLYCLSLRDNSLRLQELRQDIALQLIGNHKPLSEAVSYDVQLLQNQGNIMTIADAASSVGRPESELIYNLTSTNTVLVCAGVVITNRAWLLKILILLTRFGIDGNSELMQELKILDFNNKTEGRYKWNHLHEESYMELFLREYSWFVHSHQHWNQSLSDKGKCLLCSLKSTKKCSYKQTTRGACKNPLSDHCCSRASIKLRTGNVDFEVSPRQFVEQYEISQLASSYITTDVSELASVLWDVLVELHIAYPLTSIEGKKYYYLHDVRPDLFSSHYPSANYSLLKLPASTNRIDQQREVRDILCKIFSFQVIATGEEEFALDYGLWKMRWHFVANNTMYTVFFFQGSQQHSLYVSPPSNIDAIFETFLK